MSFDPTPYEIVSALLHWLTVFGGVLALILGVAFLTSFAMNGSEGPRLFGKQLVEGFREMLSFSRRRVWALATLTMREAFRRKALLVFVVFAILFMFGGWFLSDANARSALQIKVYVSFVLTAINWLILPVVLLLACWGLPTDIKSRSLHTVVTKPVHKNEVVLGRMLGFTIVGTLVLVVMGGVGYVWIQRQVPDEYESQLVSRVPVYGELEFLNREGQPTEAGVNVGDVWEFRSYIEGATKAAAIWDFNGIDASDLVEDSLVLESHFEAFRTHKGEIGQELLCQYVLHNDEKELEVPLPPFQVHEYNENVTEIPRSITYTDPETSATQTVDLMEDVIQDGQLKVAVKCLDAGQYLGMARPDLFIRTPDKPFASGYFKAIFGIWLEIVLIVVLGVTASCFVKGPVATLLTFTLIIVGEGFRSIMEEIVSGQLQGGGPAEAWVRMIKRLNPQVPLEEGFTTDLVQAIDAVAINGLWLVQHVIPDFQYFRMAPYVANGFDVSWNAALLPAIAVTAAYVLPCLLIGYYSLKLRELEAK